MRKEQNAEVRVLAEHRFRAGAGGVSVVVATRNRRVLLEESLRSLFAQRFDKERYEIIVVDDGSTDGTAEFVHQLAPESPVRLHYAHLEGCGAPAARNAGMHLAQGEIVAHTDDDCRLPPDWLAAGAGLFAPGVAIVSGPLVPKPEQQPRFFSWCPRLEREDGTYPTSNIFYLREAALAAGGFDEGICQDHQGRPRWGWDTKLAWELRSSGYTTRFDHGVMAFHHLWNEGLWRWLGEAWRAHMLPALIRQTPQLRTTLLWSRVFYHQSHLYFDSAVLGAVLGLAWTPYAWALTLPWLAKSVADVRAHWWPPVHWPRAAVKVALSTTHYAVRLVALLYGSLTARRLVI